MADLKMFTCWVRLWSRGLFPIPLRSLRLCVFHPLAALRFNRDVRPQSLRDSRTRCSTFNHTPPRGLLIAVLPTGDTGPG